MNTYDISTDKTANRHTLITKLCLCKLQFNSVLYWRLLPQRPRCRDPRPSPAGGQHPAPGRPHGCLFLFLISGALIYSSDVWQG